MECLPRAVTQKGSLACRRDTGRRIERRSSPRILDVKVGGTTLGTGTKKRGKPYFPVWTRIVLMTTASVGTFW